ncbi:uncharacterized protein LOC111254130 isoform X1 [Varroa destructor]|uniref:Uncharacterized protein n=1 Tax=Varroa destructor TaxID=109461 RepID=A0A7M7L4Z3_VARDE|nr:uncharacterized protein LOC111254130 isoform X1 [Varroa destructor]XP_022670414.1 uncharacterized protein LOC111254130 isoform X1 [Varroa destructor]
MSCTHRRSVRFPQVFPSVTVDQGVRELLQQTPLDNLDRSTALGFSSPRGDRENRELSLAHKTAFNCPRHRPPLKGNTKECQRLCRRAGAYDHGQCCFESDVMECGDAASCQGEGIDAPNQAAIHGRGGQSPGLLVKHSASGTGSPRLEESSTEITVANPNLIEHADALSHGKDAACSPVQSDSNLDAAPGAPETLLSFRPTYYCYRTNSNTSISNNILRQIEDDDSMAGDFNCHHFLDNDSRQRWNLQHGVTDLVRYCWANGPGASPSPGPVSSSCSDLAAHLATIDRLHDQYLESFRCSTSHTSYAGHLPHPNNFPENEDHVRRMRHVYNWFVAGSSPREKRGQFPIVSVIEKSKNRNIECKSKIDNRHTSKDTPRGTQFFSLQQTSASDRTGVECNYQSERSNPAPS